jgi:hypothetical protein
MRESHVQFAPLSAMFLALTLSTSAQAQQQAGRAADSQQPPDRATDPQLRRARDTQDRRQSARETQTIRGVVAAVTAAGEVIFDHRSNRAAAAGAAFVTVIGSPTNSEGALKDRAGATATERDRAASTATEREHAASPATDTDRTGSLGRKRHNVYIVWLTPQTKICESSAPSEKSTQTQGQSQADKREIALDQLEVGDHVEVQFSRREDSGQSQSVHQTEAMRRSHGRHRTFVGHATSITILPYIGHDESRNDGESRLNERS